MSPKDLAYWRADAESTKSIEDLKGKIEYAALSIKYGMNPWFYEELLQVYLYEYSWRNSADTKNRYYQKTYINGYYI